MAPQVLKKGQAIVHVPPRAQGERAFASEPSLLVRLSAAPGSDWLRTSLDALPAVRAVTLVFDARDVTLVPAVLPPLSGARLRQAVPNVVEDLLLQDAQHCAFAIGPQMTGGERLVAVIDRVWLEFVIGAFERRGIRVLAAWPAQLTLPHDGAAATLACLGDGLSTRSGEFEGLGWPAGSTLAERTEALLGLVQAGVVDGEAPLRVLCEDDGWSEAVRAAAARLGCDWLPQALPIPEPAPLDLLSARPGSRAGRLFADFDWRAWRWPATLAAACALVAVIGLNLHWGLLARERDALRQAIELTYRQAFPDVQVIVDPVLQMERQVAALRTRAGQSGPEDFVPLLTRFSQALGVQAADALAGVEYRDGRLRVRFQPGRFEARELRDALVTDSQRLGLQLRFDADREPGATVALLR